MARSVEKERISQDEIDEALGRIELGTDYAPDADLAIEAVVETIEVKKEVFRALNEQLGDEAILATNTSSNSVTLLGALSGRPDRLIGMHFFNPVPVMKLVEIVRGTESSDETYQTAHELAERLGKEPVEVQDFPGFVSNSSSLGIKPTSGPADGKWARLKATRSYIVRRLGSLTALKRPFDSLRQRKISESHSTRDIA